MKQTEWIEEIHRIYRTHLYMLRIGYVLCYAMLCNAS
jgi:hypothetical protein